MTEAIFLSVVALITGIEGGSAEIDKGLINGLRSGDTAAIYYTLTVNGEEKRIPVAFGTLREVGDFYAAVDLQDPEGVRTGYSAEIGIPESRVSPESLLQLARSRAGEQKYEEAGLYLERVRDLVPDDPFVKQELSDLEERKHEYDLRQRELGKLPYYRTVARELFERGDFDRVREYLEKISRVRPDDPVARDLAGKLDELEKLEELKKLEELEKLEELKKLEELEKLEEFEKLEKLQKKELEEKTAEMVLVAGGKYQIGLDLPEAKFYNQQPQFTATLESFWMDREPAAARGMSFQEADDSCRSLGKRLPTEFEWEAAMLQQGSGSGLTISEWTASWYQAYPGNVIWEEEYGKKFRVLRSRENPRMRYYMTPGESKPEVGFRCALDAVEGQD